MKRLLIILAALLPLISSAQYSSNSDRPTWLEGYFSEQPNSYIEVVSAIGYSEDEARGKAAQIIVERRSLATGQRNAIDIRNGNIVVNGKDDLTVKSRIIDQYTEYIAPGTYRVSLLVQTAKNPSFSYESVFITDKYKVSPSVLVPGMAQIHKGQTLKGVLFITGEIAAVTGCLIFEGMRSSYESKIKQTHNANDMQSYINKADNMRNIRNGFIAGAVAIYAWNVIDGIVSKGKKHVVVDRAHIAISPYTDMQSAGLYMAITF